MSVPAPPPAVVVGAAAAWSPCCCPAGASRQPTGSMAATHWSRSCSLEACRSHTVEEPLEPKKMVVRYEDYRGGGAARWGAGDGGGGEEEEDDC